VRYGAANFGCYSPERQALTAQFRDFPDHHLLLGQLYQRSIHADPPPERRGTAEEAPPLLLVGLGPEDAFLGSP
jgi:hypothetical protein